MTQNVIQCVLSTMQNQPYTGRFEEKVMNELELWRNMLLKQDIQ